MREGLTYSQEGDAETDLKTFPHGVPGLPRQRHAIVGLQARGAQVEHEPPCVYASVLVYVCASSAEKGDERAPKTALGVRGLAQETVTGAIASYQGLVSSLCSGRETRRKR